MTDHMSKPFEKGFGTILKLSPVPHLKWLQGNKFHPASPSSVEQAWLCPRKWDSNHAGLTVPIAVRTSNEAADFGTLAHESAEYSCKFNAPIPEEVMIECPKLKERIDYYHKLGTVLTEVKLSIDSMGVSSWVNRTIGMIIDLMVWISPEHVVVADWKTNSPYNAMGKRRSVAIKPLQLEMIAIALFFAYPKLKEVTSRYEFLRYQFAYTFYFKREQWTYGLVNAKGKKTTRDFVYPKMVEHYWRMQAVGTYRYKRNPLCKDWCNTKCVRVGKKMNEE